MQIWITGMFYPIPLQAHSTTSLDVISLEEYAEVWHMLMRVREAGLDASCYGQALLPCKTHTHTHPFAIVQWRQVEAFCTACSIAKHACFSPLSHCMSTSVGRGSEGSLAMEQAAFHPTPTPQAHLPSQKKSWSFKTSWAKAALPTPVSVLRVHCGELGKRSTHPYKKKSRYTPPCTSRFCTSTLKFKSPCIRSVLPGK